MKTVKGLIIVTAAIASFCLVSQPAWAGSKQQHRWEGVAIGVGAAVLGHALVSSYAHGYHSAPPAAFSYHHYTYRAPAGPHHGPYRYAPKAKHYRDHHYGYNHNSRHAKQWRSHDNGRKRGWAPHEYRHHGGSGNHRSDRRHR